MSIAKAVVSQLAVLMAVTLSTQVGAQSLRYTPRTPTISPYVNLFRGDAGGVNNYFGLVRPQQRQIAFNRNQLTENRRLEQQSQLNRRMLTQQPSQPGQATSGSQPLRMLRPTIASPVSAATYLNYSGFYNAPGLGGASSAGGRPRRGIVR